MYAVHACVCVFVVVKFTHNKSLFLSKIYLCFFFLFFLYFIFLYTICDVLNLNSCMFFKLLFHVNFENQFLHNLFKLSVCSFLFLLRIFTFYLNHISLEILRDILLIILYCYYIIIIYLYVHGNAIGLEFYLH